MVGSIKAQMRDSEGLGTVSGSQRDPRLPDWFNLPSGFALTALSLLKMRPAVLITGRITWAFKKIHLHCSILPPETGSRGGAQESRNF